MRIPDGVWMREQIAQAEPDLAIIRVLG